MLKNKNKNLFVLVYGLVVVMLSLSLSSCSPNKTEVSSWWYNQRWESAEAGK